MVENLHEDIKIEILEKSLKDINVRSGENDNENLNTIHSIIQMESQINFV